MTNVTKYVLRRAATVLLLFGICACILLAQGIRQTEATATKKAATEVAIPKQKSIPEIVIPTAPDIPAVTTIHIPATPATTSTVSTPVPPATPLAITVSTKGEIPEVIQEKMAARAAAKIEAETAKETAKVAVATYDTVTSTYTVEIYNSIEELAANCSLSVEDIIALAQTYHGECDCVASQAERSMVIWVILNRLDTPGYGFGNTVYAICTADYQFTGYSPNNPVTERALEMVSDVVMRWEAEKRGETCVGRTIPKEYLFFHADSNPSIGSWHNAFYRYTEVNRGDKIYFDRDHPMENPYEN
ncbi:cell wall hydrolase [Candidatus Saccharibacteria bacterium]|nr:cell wall hydrolase [Candidatus Saccharibacteria bacterium]